MSKDFIKEYLIDFPPGPLDTYRKNASFDWKVMKLLIEDEELLNFEVSKNLCFNKLVDYTLFLAFK